MGSKFEQSKDLKQKQRRSILKRTWEILRGLKSGERFREIPSRFLGDVSASYGDVRKFQAVAVVESGIISIYRKTKGCQNIDTSSPSDTQIDLGLSVVWKEQKGRRILIELNGVSYNLKLKDRFEGLKWAEALRTHRLFRQDQIEHGDSEYERRILRKRTRPASSCSECSVVDRRSSKTNRRRRLSLLRLSIDKSNLKLCREHTFMARLILDEIRNRFTRFKAAWIRKKTARHQSGFEDMIWLTERFVMEAECARNALRKLLESQQTLEKQLQMSQARSLKRPRTTKSSGFQRNNQTASSNEKSVRSTTSRKIRKSNERSSEPSLRSATSRKIRKSNKRSSEPTKSAQCRPSDTCKRKSSKNNGNTAVRSWMEKGAGEEKRRTELPFSKDITDQPLSFWKARSNFAEGRLELPIKIFEPLSLLQVFCQELENSFLLDSAVRDEEPTGRMCFVAGYCISRLGHCQERSGHTPLTPLMGETFSLNRWTERGWKVFAEQVSQHPPISAMHADGREGWTLWQDGGESLLYKSEEDLLELTTDIQTGLVLKKYKERYSWGRNNFRIANLSNPSQRKAIHTGKIEIQSTSGLTCTLNFEETEGISGKIENSSGGTEATLVGKWTEGMRREGSGTGTIFRKKPLPTDWKKNYAFTYFVRELNDPKAKAGNLPPTDSRFRPDLRLLENGNFEKAEGRKKELEENQRQKLQEQEEHLPLWFKPVSGPKGRIYWISRGNYFTESDKRFQDIKYPSLLW